MSDVERNPLFSTDDEGLCIAYCYIILPALYIGCVLSMIPAVYKYVASGRKQTSRNNCLYYLGIALFVSVIVTMLQMVVCILATCHYSQVRETLSVYAHTTYGVSYWLLLAFCFCRLYFVFGETALALSRRTITIWWLLYSMAVGVGATTFVALSYPDHWGNIGLLLLVSTLVMVSGLIVFMNVMFVYKLVQVYKNVDSDRKLINVITKTSLLAIISTQFTLLSGITGVLVRSAPSFHMGFATRFMLFVDCVTNFWCTLLTYRYFNAWYEKVCCHAKCHRFWVALIGRDEVMLSNELESTA